MSEYDVFRIDDEDNRSERAGRVSLDPAFHLALIEAETDAAADLNEAIEELNGSETLLWKHPGPKLNEDGRTVVAKDEIARSEPNFMQALQDNLRRWHALELDIEGPEDEDDDEYEDEDEEDEDEVDEEGEEA